MTENKTCNMSKGDSKIRFIIAIALAFFSIFYQNYYILAISIILFYTSMKKYCLFYYIFNINEKLRVKSHYLSYLPQHNPSAVFIFGTKGNIVFENNAAKTILSNIHSIDNLDIFLKIRDRYQDN